MASNSRDSKSVISNSLQSRNAVDTMVEKAEVSSEVWVSEGSRSTANQMIEKLHDKSGYLLETKAVSMTSEQENNSQELEMVGPLSDHLEKLHQDFTLSYSQFQLLKHFSKPLPYSLSKTLETHPPPTASFYLLRFSSAGFSVMITKIPLLVSLLLSNCPTHSLSNSSPNLLSLL